MYHLLFAALVFLFLTTAMLPLGNRPNSLPRPDLMFCLIAAWTLRRPEYLSPFMIVGVVLLTEILFLKPLGLWTALVLVASEIFRSNVERIRFLSFPYEWMMVSGIFVCLTVLYQLVLVISFVPAPEIGGAALHLLATAAAYPVVVAVSNLVFRVRKAGPAELGLFEGRS